MSHEIIPNKRLRSWIIGAVGVPAASMAAGCTWLAVLLAAVGCGLISIAVQRWCSGACAENKVIAAVQWAWLGLFLGAVAKYSADFWPDGNAYPIVPVTLIVLACLNAGKGANSGKTGAVLTWFAVTVIAAVLAAGTTTINAQWMLPKKQTFNPNLVSLLLIPCLTVYLPTEKRKRSISTAVCLTALAVIPALWVVASLSPGIAAASENALYEYGKSISLFGTVERFESVLSCAVTVGWFCLFSLILETAGQIEGKGKVTSNKSAVWGSGGLAAAAMLLKWTPDP